MINSIANIIHCIKNPLDATNHHRTLAMQELDKLLEKESINEVFLVLEKLQNEPLVYRNRVDAEKKMFDLTMSDIAEYRITKEIIR